MQAVSRQALALLRSRRDALTDHGFDINLLRIAAAQEVNSLALPQHFTLAADDVVRHNVAASKRLFGISVQHVPGLGARIDAFKASNLLLIQGLVQDQVADIERVLSDPENLSLSVDALAELLMQRAGVAESRANLIAADQLLKLNGQVTQARQQSAGIEKYIWTTSLDERVRPSHMILEGKVFSWNAPPPPGHPGEDYRCRCTAFPLLEELDVF